jgi:hypothetical protein
LIDLEQYEAYKADLKKNAHNRVYTSWQNIKGTIKLYMLK